MRYQVAQLCVLGIAAYSLASGAPAMADHCSDYPSDAIFCDDFDAYCDPPPGGDVCEPSATPDNDAFRNVWPADGACDPLSAMHFLGTTPDARGTYASQAIQRGDGWVEETYDYLYRHVHDLTADILAHPDNIAGDDGINGAGDISRPLDSNGNVPSGYVDSMDRNQRPLALKGSFYFQPLPGANGAGFANMIYYHEFHLDDDRAPTDFVTQDCDFWHDCNCDGGGCAGVCDTQSGTCTTTSAPCAADADCATCDGGLHDGETCANDNDCQGGPLRPIIQTTDGTVHASFAVGMMSIMDLNPCDLDQGWFPSVWRLVVFDGLRWHKFQAPWYDLPLTNPADYMDLYPIYGWNRIEFAIGEDYIEVRITNVKSEAWHDGTGTCLFGQCIGGSEPFSYCETDDDCDSGPAMTPYAYLVARVPREYKGPFNQYALGPGKGRDLTDPQNPGPETCMEAFSSSDVLSDEIVLYDGVFEPTLPQGACCLPDLSCVETDEDHCENTLNGTWQGSGTECATTACCHVPWADTDGDDDVDQVDFAVFQRCYTGQGGTYAAGCECYDRFDDGDVGPLDFDEFQNCVTGPEMSFLSDPPTDCNY